MSSILYQIPGVRQLQTKLNQLSSYIPPPPRERAAQPLRILLVHALDTPDPDAVRDEIKNRYERRLKEIFE